MSLSLLNDSIIATKDERGVFIYKANPDYKPFKKDNTLRQHYKDMPRFKVIIEAESKTVTDYVTELASAVKEMSETLNTFGH